MVVTLFTVYIIVSCCISKKNFFLIIILFKINSQNYYHNVDGVKINDSRSETKLKLEAAL